MLSQLSRVQLFVRPWTIALWAPLSMRFSRQEYWCELQYPPLGDLPDQGSNQCLLRLLHSLMLRSPGNLQVVSVQFSRSVVCDSLDPLELQHTRPPCPSPAPRVYSNTCPSSQWCHPAISSSVIPFSSCPQSPSSIRVFSNESTLHMRWPKYWSFSFSISPSNEHPGLISFRTDWLDLLAVQGTLKSLLQHHSSKHQFFGA